MKKLLLLGIPAFIFAQNLKSLIEYAQLRSDLVVAKTLSKDAQSKNVDSKERAYLPTIDVGGYYQSVQDKTPTQAGDVYSGYAKVGFDIYDGGKKLSLLEEARYLYRASVHDEKETRNSLALQITENFYMVKNLQASLRAKEEAGKSLQEQLERIKKYFEARLATKDDIDRLQAAYDTNIYDIESLKLDILAALKSLELKVGKNIETLEDSNFREFIDESLENRDAINSLMAKESAMISSSKYIESAYYPQIRVEDSFNIYGYDRADALYPKGLDNQNKILLSANMRLFDFGTISKSKEVVQINAQALKSEISYMVKEQKMQQEIAIFRIQTSKVKIKSASSALTAASSAFKTINEKYKAGIVDYVIYLDALTSKTKADSLYESSLNELETAYAMYYYYSGKNLEEFLK